MRTVLYLFHVDLSNPDWTYVVKLDEIGEYLQE